MSAAHSWIFVLNFRTCYYGKFDTLHLHTDPFDIARHYLRTFFVLDLATSFPFELVIDTDLHSGWVKIFRVFRLLRVLKILRVIRVAYLFNGVIKHRLTSRHMAILRLCKVV